jgi:hypothetical protein
MHLVALPVGGSRSVRGRDTAILAKTPAVVAWRYVCFARADCRHSRVVPLRPYDMSPLSNLRLAVATDSDADECDASLRIRAAASDEPDMTEVGVSAGTPWTLHLR